MKLKKPSLNGMKNTGYLGHFAQDKWICKGHNENSYTTGQRIADNLRKAAQAGGGAEASDGPAEDCSNLAGEAWKACRARNEKRGK